MRQGEMHQKLGCSPQTALKEQYSAIEESRADLVALYFLPDPKLVEMGLMRAEDHDDVVRAEYENYARTPLAQLRRIREGTTIEEDHMRNRQMIVHWLMANTKAIEKRMRDGKTYYVMLDRTGVSRRRRPAARRGAAHQGERRLRGRKGAVRHLRHSLRSRAARRDRRARRQAQAAVVYRVSCSRSWSRCAMRTARSATCESPIRWI